MPISLEINEMTKLFLSLQKVHRDLSVQLKMPSGEKYIITFLGTNQ